MDLEAKAAGLREAGLRVTRLDPLGSIYFHVPGYERVPLETDPAGNTVIDWSNETYTEENGASIRLVLWSAKELVSDLFGFEHQHSLLYELQERGWHGHDTHGGFVIVEILDDVYFVSARCFGFEVHIEGDTDHLSELVRARIKKKLERLRKDICDIHLQRPGKALGMITDYIRETGEDLQQFESEDDD